MPTLAAYADRRHTPVAFVAQMEQAGREGPRVRTPPGVGAVSSLVGGAAPLRMVMSGDERAFFGEPGWGRPILPGRLQTPGV